MKRAALLLLLAASPVLAQAGADGHMLAGAQYFQAGRFTEALSSFASRNARRSDGGAIWYIAATLVKLKRPEDAISEFARAEGDAQRPRRALRLLPRARVLRRAPLPLRGSASRRRWRAGAVPASRHRRRRSGRTWRLCISTPPSRRPSTGTTRGRRRRSATQRAALGAVYFEEAARLAALRSDGYRRLEAARGDGARASHIVSQEHAR